MTSFDAYWITGMCLCAFGKPVHGLIAWLVAAGELAIRIYK